jgi:hypothetical protein
MVISPFPANLVVDAGGVKPVITADVRVSYYPYDAVEGTIPLTLGSSSIPVRVEATRYGAALATTNNLANTVTGYAVQTIDEVSGNFFGKISVEVQCDVDTFYTLAQFASVVDADQLKTDMAAWAVTDLKLDVLGTYAQVVCQFGG